jgi:hypothetical protein
MAQCLAVISAGVLASAASPRACLPVDKSQLDQTVRLGPTSRRVKLADRPPRGNDAIYRLER